MILFINILLAVLLGANLFFLVGNLLAKRYQSAVVSLIGAVICVWSLLH